MPARTALNLNASVGVSLVNGDSATRHARQIMLRSLGYNVRSYATCVALLTDPRPRDQQCIIIDIDTPKVDGIDLLRAMRAGGWRGKGILLARIPPESEVVREAERHGDKVLDHAIGDGRLIAAIATSTGSGLEEWSAGV